jgi:hypothetical protein
MGIRSSIALAAIVMIVLGLVFVSAKRPAQDNDWQEPFPAFRIADNLYYVGSKGLANYLITTPQGHILINSDMEENVPPPGHTKGCTTWTMKVKDGSKMRDVVIVGSPNVNPGYNLVNSKVYPEMKQDFERTFAVLKSLPCDYFLGAHGSYFGLEPKYERFKSGATVFIDPDGYKAYVAEREQAFRLELSKQQTNTK